jgi:hypothetical protein
MKIVTSQTFFRILINFVATRALFHDRVAKMTLNLSQKKKHSFRMMKAICHGDRYLASSIDARLLMPGTCPLGRLFWLTEGGGITWIPPYFFVSLQLQ